MTAKTAHFKVSDSAKERAHPFHAGGEKVDHCLEAAVDLVAELHGEAEVEPAEVLPHAAIGERVPKEKPTASRNPLTSELTASAKPNLRRGWSQPPRPLPDSDALVRGMLSCICVDPAEPCAMCTVYRIGHRAGAHKTYPDGRWRDEDLGEERVIRPTLSGPVILDDGMIHAMRWGFERSWSNAIVNAREDKLDGVWKRAFTERRCVIPAGAYYEWSGESGRKQAHCFSAAGGGLLWIAGIWEEHPDHGCCYNMVTTTPNSFASAYHDRMPALLTAPQITAYMAGEIDRFRPPEDLLVVDDVPSPLKRETAQGELF